MPLSAQDNSPLSNEEFKAINELLVWGKNFYRDFPWRRTREPYEILIAEKLLQQTAAGNSVINAYKELLAMCPTVLDLAESKISTLQQIIKPLGFLYRAKELKTLGEAIVTKHQGQIPTKLDGLLLLPGVGDYIARAVLSFALGNDIAVIDTNVARFVFRFYGILGPLPSNPARKKSLITLAQRLMPNGLSREFNFAVLDLCTLVCKSSYPQCHYCPVNSVCAFGKQVHYKNQID